MPFDGTGFDFDPRITPRHLAILREARARIAEPGGWCQGVLHNGRGSTCVMGAILDARHRHRLYDAGGTAQLAGEALVPVLHDARRWAYPDQTFGWQVSNFNDHPGTMKADVVSLFDRGIERAERMLALRRVLHPTRWERFSDRLRAFFGRPALHDFHGSTMTNAPLSAVLAAADQNSSKTLSLA
jgi:hypothetical protein